MIRNTRTTRTALTLLALAVSLPACKKDEEENGNLTAAEAQQALTESASAASVESMTSSEIELTTDFTIGEGVEKAAADIREFYESQIPCADVSLERARVTVDFGVDGDCPWRGRTYTGQKTVEVGRASREGVQVTHGWTDFSNGAVTVTGESIVDWTFGELSRSVTHDLSWTDTQGRSASGSGTRTQVLIDETEGLAAGIRVDGERNWTGGAGTWTLDVQGVEVRGEDPVPQAGTYVLTTPNDKTLSLGFSRVDADVIKVTVSFGRRSFDFNVRRSGSVEQA